MFSRKTRNALVVSAKRTLITKEKVLLNGGIRAISNEVFRLYHSTHKDVEGFYKSFEEK